jgi:hypothetical protein
MKRCVKPLAPHNVVLSALMDAPILARRRVLFSGAFGSGCARGQRSSGRALPVGADAVGRHASPGPGMNGMPATMDAEPGLAPVVLIIGREDVGSASGPASPLTALPAWLGAVTGVVSGALGPGLTSESADAARAVLLTICRPGPSFFRHPPALPV